MAPTSSTVDLFSSDTPITTSFPYTTTAWGQSTSFDLNLTSSTQEPDKDKTPHTTLAWILYSAIAVILLFTLFHAIAKFALNMWVFLEVLIRGKGVKSFIAFVFTALYVPYTAFVWYAIMLTIDWDAFERFDMPEAFFNAGLKYPQSLFLYPEIGFVTFLSALEVLSAVESWLMSPSENKILKEFQKLKSAPHVNIVMPIYNEPLPSLMAAINSAVGSKYPGDKVELMLAFDEEKKTDLFMGTMYCLTKHADSQPGSVTRKMYKEIQKNIEELKKEMQGMVFPQINFITYRGIQLTVCRFPHGGKRHAQRWAFRALQERWGESEEKPLLLFIDSDIVLDPYAIHMFAWEFVKPISSKKRRPWGVTGLILCKTKGNWNILTALQDAEYIKGQVFVRQLEQVFGFVTCLPGALTMMTYEGLETVSDKYFFPGTKKNSAYDFGRTQLGEDRYLTHLFMIHSKARGATSYQSAARCETEGVPSFYSLMKQRRRWLLGSVTNSMEMYADVGLWKLHAFPIFFTSLRQFTGAPIVVFYIQMAKVIVGESTTIWWYLPAIIILGSSYLFLIANTFRIQHKRITVFYPILLLLLPLFMLFVEVYSCLTLRQQTWGGPRVAKDPDDASKTRTMSSIRHSMRDRVPSLV